MTAGLRTSFARPLQGNVLNETQDAGSISINAQSAIWDDWDGGTTQLWSCDSSSGSPNYGSCTCNGPNCPSGGLPNGTVDVVYLSTNTTATPVDSTNGSQTPTVCPCVQGADCKP